MSIGDRINAFEYTVKVEEKRERKEKRTEAEESINKIKKGIFQFMHAASIH